MTPCAQLLISAFFSLACLPVLAQTQIRLLCKGDLNTTVDAKPSVTQLLLDVTINTESKTMKIPGSYGCIGNIGNKNMVCSDVLPVTVKDDEIISLVESDGEYFKGSTVVNINRYSGTLTISGLAFAKPAAQAQWVTMMTDAKLSCIIMNRPAF